MAISLLGYPLPCPRNVMLVTVYFRFNSRWFRARRGGATRQYSVRLARTAEGYRECSNRSLAVRKFAGNQRDRIVPESSRAFFGSHFNG
jgi:hypothetical protein